MNIIFIHPNFPAQFRHMAALLGRDPDNRVIFITANPRPEWQIPGVKKIVFKIPDIPLSSSPESSVPDTFAMMQAKGESRGRYSAGL